MGLSANGIGFNAFTMPTGIFGPAASGVLNSPPADGPPPDDDNSWFDLPDPGQMWDSIVSTVTQTVNDTVESVVNYVTPQLSPWGSTELSSGSGLLDFFTAPNPMSQHPIPLADDVLTILPGIKPLVNAGANAFMSAVAPTDEETYSAAVDHVYATAQDAKEQVGTGYMSDLQAFQLVLKDAAEQSGNDPEGFIQLVNEAVLGDKANEPGNGWSFYDTHEGKEPINFGDSGVHENYQDYSSNQLSYHYWAYVNQGHMGLGAAAHYLNFSHEKGACGQSIEDFDIGVLGVQMGNDLRTGELTPEEFAEKFPEYLGTDEHSDFQFVTSLLDRSEESPLGVFGDAFVMPSSKDPDYVSCEAPPDADADPAAADPAAAEPGDELDPRLERLREREEMLEAAEADDEPADIPAGEVEEPEDIAPALDEPESNGAGNDDSEPEPEPVSQSPTGSTTASSSGRRRHGGEAEMM